MQNKLNNPLPKTHLMLPGAVYVQWRRCGKPNCRCRDGVNLHGPYYFRFWRQGGKLRKRYVKREEVEQVKQACQTERDWQARQRQERTSSRQLLQTMRQMLRDMEGTA